MRSRLWQIALSLGETDARRSGQFTNPLISAGAELSRETPAAVAPRNMEGCGYYGHAYRLVLAKSGKLVRLILGSFPCFAETGEPGRGD